MIHSKLFKEIVTTQGKYGNGLGLQLSYQLIEGKFRGDLGLEFVTGKGTGFNISIPRNPIPDVEFQNDSEKNR